MIEHNGLPMRLLSSLFSLLLFFAASGIAAAAPNLNDIDTLAQQGKLGDINQRLPLIIKQARARKDHTTWRDALLLLANTKLDPSYANTINTLLNRDWPSDSDSQLLLNLHLAHYLSRYISNNRWEIRARDVMKSTDPIPLEKQTMAQLLAAMHQAFAKAYNQSLKNTKTLKQFTKPSLKRLDSFFTDATYPDNVRGTLRDTVAYLWASTLTNNSYWTPAQDNQAARLLTPKLLATPYRDPVNPSDLKQHPLKRAVKILSDLEQFQRSRRNADGALEAFNVRIAAISRSKRSTSDKAQLIHALRLRIKQQLNTKQPAAWLNKLRLDLATKLKNQHLAEANIQSLAALQPCLNSTALAALAAQCQALADDITAPFLSIESRASDGLNKRSIKVIHKNLDTVYFKAWRVDAKQAAFQNADYRSGQLIEQQLAQQRAPDVTWAESVKNTADHKNHSSYLTPPINQKGYWLIAASNQQDFPDKNKAGSYLVATTLTISDLTVDVRVDRSSIEVVTYQGESGQPLSGVSVEAWQPHKKQPAQRVRSNQNGVAKLNLPKGKAYVLLLKYQGDLTTIDAITLYNYGRKTNNKVKDALIFTDRSIYRPAQTIQWKVVAYQGDRQPVRYRVSPKSTGWISLYDANNKVVKKLPITTNHFGSASGEFTVEAGRLLGNWRIDTAWGGSKSIKVEEYKRPTFKARIAKPKQALRLNYPANLTGSASYYFGGAVTEGSVSWRIKRQGGYFVDQYVEEETVANGTTTLNAEGEFAVSFKPSGVAGSSDQSETQTIHRYELSADVTDSGGETRSVNRTFSIGTTTVRALITPEAGFAIAGKPFKLTISRQDLDGNANAGSAFWSFHRVQQPKQMQMPSEFPIHFTDKGFATAGDALSPRWANYQGFNKHTQQWRDAQKLTQGSVRHNATGVAVV